MSWLRRKPKPAPLLSDAEMAKLHEEIFEEPLSIERLFAIYDSAPRANDRDHEWVMDKRMFNRVRRLRDGCGEPLSPPPEHYGLPLRLIGLPIAIEPFAKLGIRERVTA